VFRWKERGIATYIPFVGHVRDDVLLHEDGSLTAILAIGGIPWQTTDAAVIIARHGDYHNGLRNANDDTLTISTYQCRGMADPSLYPKRRLPSRFASAFDDLYREHLFTGRLYNNQLYIAVTIRPASYVSKFITGQVRKRRKPVTSANTDRLERLDTVCALLQAKLRDYLPTRLGVRRVGHAWFSAMAEALVFAMTGIWRPIGLTTGPLKNAMFSERIIVGREAIEIRTPGWSAYGAIFGVKEYPTATWPGMFGALSTSAYRCTLFQAFSFVGKAQAEGIINRKQNFMIGAEDKAFEQLDELRQAGNDLMANKMILGEHTISLIVFADSMKELKFVTTETWRDLADSGAVVARETAALEAALFSFLPGNDRLWPRPGFITSRNFAAMAPLHNFPAGPEVEHWGEPIAIFRTTAATPYRFHWHADGVANVLVTGETGSGKSLLVAFLMAMTAGRARIFALDYKRGWELLFRTMNADYAVIGDGEPHLSPLKVLAPTPKNLTFLNDLIRGCIGQKLTAEEDRRLPLALKIVMALPPAERSLGEIAAFLGTDPNGAGTALQRWCWGNELGWVIDAPEDHMDFSGDLIGRDLTALLENPRARAPALLTIFHYIELQLDGRPILIPNDEGWRSLLDENFRPMIEKRLRTIRSFGGAFVFLTQGPDEIKKSDIGAVLVQQCPTQICLPVDRANVEDYKDVLKLSDGEWEAFAEIRKGDRRFLIRQGERSVVAELVLPNVDDHIATLSANQETLNALDEVRRITRHRNKEPFDEHLPEVHRIRRAIIERRKNNQKQKELV
jgi:type IV secretion system protein VirB4